MEEVTICLQCGDKGFSNAFVYCVNCLNFAVHRYCLYPLTFDESVYWVCDDCEVELPRKLTTLNCKTIESDGRDHTSLKILEEQRTLVCSKGRKRNRPRLQHRFRKRNRAFFSQEKLRPILESRCSELHEVSELPLNSLLSTKLKRKESSGLRIKGEDDGLQPAEANAELEITKTSNGIHKLSFIKRSKKKRKRANYSAAKAPKKGGKKCEVSQQATTHLENSSPVSSVEHAKPLIEPIWRGGFVILNKDYDAFDGLVAHLSSKVGWKVYEEARLFPALLDLEMYPKDDVWPKSFKKSEPSDDNIALYFFALDDRYKKLFDHLVEDMMQGELALKATVENAELLVFASNELPINYWKFQGKYYLWGVFRAKQALSSLTVEDSIMELQREEPHTGIDS